MALTATVAALAWMENRRAGKPLTPQALTTLVNAGQAVVVDLRDKADYEKGHIVDSIHLPFSKWQAETAADNPVHSLLDKHRDKPLILVCKMGQQSSHVAKRMQHAGFDSIYRLTGGVMEWQHAQMPLVK